MKDKLTQEFYKFKNIPYNNIDYRKFKTFLWHNPRSSESGKLRLSDEGFKFLEPNIKFYKIELPELITWTNELTILLDRYIDCPWYYYTRGIRAALYVSREKVAIQMILFDGNVYKFVEGKKRKLKVDANIEV